MSPVLSSLLCLCALVFLFPDFVYFDTSLTTQKKIHLCRVTEALSYFVGGDNVEDGYCEDGGFAINGGKGWTKVKMVNHRIDLNGPVAIAMGEYFFWETPSSKEEKVEYTFGYKRNDDGKARIFLHHSSKPFSLEDEKKSK